MKTLYTVLNMKLLMRIDNLFGRIEDAFAGQPFLPGVPPDAKANQLRVGAYATDFAQAAKLLGYAIELSKITSSMTTTKPTGTGA